MDKVVCKTSGVEIQNENVSPNFEKDVSYADAVMSSNDVSHNTDKNLETKENVNGHIESDSENNYSESVKASDSSFQKGFSPTLIGSAIKVVKNLFSPDKTKSKPSALNPINQQRNASGSPCSSIYIQGKELFSSEEILNTVQPPSGEKGFKNHLQVYEVGGMPSPLTLDLHNNTDDSFLTTASLIDDSFHSAVTHLDEQGDPVKNGVNFMENIFNNSQNLDLLNPCNNTLENQNSFAENTVLKMDSLTPEKNNEFNNTIQSKEEKFENLSGIQNGDFAEVSGKDQNEILNETISKDATNSTSEFEMAHIFLNKSFKRSFNAQLENDNSVKSNKNEICIEELDDVQEIAVESSISTTTVVLNTVESVDLDNMLTSLKADDYMSSLTSFGVGDDENMESEPLINELAYSLPKTPTDNNFSSATELCPPAKEKKSYSEGNSPNTGTNFSKAKLNKSDELVNRRLLNDPLEGKRAVNEKKSSVDISLMKNSEASKISKKLRSTPAKMTLFDKKHESNIGESHLTPNKVNTIPAISQQSYTILTKDNSLNRPVIESSTFQTNQSNGNTDNNSIVNNSFGGEEIVRTSQMKQSTPVWEGDNKKVERCIKPTSLKFPSPELKLDNSDEKEIEKLSNKKPELQTFFSKESPMEISPVKSDEFSSETGGSFNELTNSKTFKDLKELNKTFDKLQESPGIPRLSHTFEKKPTTPTSTEASNNLNQTFDKISVSPNTFNSTFTKNRKSAENEKVNLTFNLSPEIAQTDKTFCNSQLNETFDKKSDKVLEPSLHKEGNDNKTDFTFIKENERSTIMNKTFGKNEILEKTTPEQTTEIIIGEPQTRCEAEINSYEDFNGKNKNFESGFKNNINESLGSPKSSNTSVFCSDISTVMLNDEELTENQNVDDLTKKLGKMYSEEELLRGHVDEEEPVFTDCVSSNEQVLQTEDKLLHSLKDEKLHCDPDLVQLIEEQFSSNDIEKICSVVQDMSAIKLSNDILRASEQFDKSFHCSISDGEFKMAESGEEPEKTVNPLSPQSFDFLSSIRGKPTGRDLSRESLYVKFDPLVQPSSNSLIDFTKEGEALATVDASPPNTQNSSICEQLLAISPQKKPDDIVPPLTPLSHKTKGDKIEKLKELQNEIYFLKNLYAEREKTNRAKMEDFESQIAKLTGENCLLEDKLKESNEREKSLVKKIKEQTQNIGQLQVIMEEYVKVISKLTTELESLRNENAKQIETLSSEKDSYMTHLQNTEAAFTDVHAKYEKSKKTIASLKTNEVKFRNTITEQAQILEDFKVRAKEAQEKVLTEVQKVQQELTDTKANYAHEAARLRAQLRKTELKVEALQETLDQKIKENQQLTSICDELIEGKK